MGCTHPFPDLGGSIVGLVCCSCRERFEGDLAVFTLLNAVRAHFKEMDGRIEKAEMALAELGLLCCERCGAWLRPKDRGTFNAKHDGGDLVLCSSCVAASLEDEDDERLFDPKAGEVPPALQAKLCRWALRALPDAPVRAQIARAFPAAWEHARAALP